MEKLLNVKEAAAFLQVSEMTIRRWTNAGLLHCFRIGNKRERRFTRQGLEEYLAAGTGLDQPPPAVPTGVPLGFGDFSVVDGAHLTHLYFDAREALEVQAAYLRQGLENGETALVVAPDDSRRTLMQLLAQGGLDVPGLISQNRLHQDSGRENPTDLAAYISQVAAAGRGRFRLLGDMAWAKRKGWSPEKIRALEENTNTRLSPGALFLCQYGLAEFSGRETMMACETHRYAIYKGRLKESLLF